MDSNNIIDFLKAKFLGQQTLSELLALTRDRSGYQREDAVRRLGKLGDPAFLADIIERANDWVPEVRKASYDAILNLCKPGNAPAFIAALPDFLHLEHCNRADHSGLLGKIRDYLCNEEYRDLLISQMTADDPRVAKMVCMLVMQKQFLGAEETMSRCLSHPDVIVRSMAADSLRKLEDGPFNTFVDRALSDGFMPVRRESFQQLLTRDRARGLDIARHFLFDNHSAIRTIALSNLVSDGYDVVAIYDTAHASAKRVKLIVCILWGWATLNSVTKAEEIKGYLVSKSSTLRRSALQALTKLSVKDAEPYLVTALKDDTRSVCADASRLILKLKIPLSAKQLVTIAQEAKTSHAVIACYTIAAKTNKWDWLQVTLQLYMDEPSHEIRNLLAVQIKNWNNEFNKNAAQPTSQQISSLLTSVRHCADKIDSNQLALLKFTLKGYDFSVPV